MKYLKYAQVKVWRGWRWRFSPNFGFTRAVALEIFVTYLSPLMPLHHAAGIGGT
jgi:hypothetical protein